MIVKNNLLKIKNISETVKTIPEIMDAATAVFFAFTGAKKTS